jgi:hypothetical protein
MALSPGRRSARALLLAAAAVAGILPAMLMHQTPALALGPGKVCMFNAPNGVTAGPVALGHVGWSYQIGGTTSYTYGATDGTGSPFIGSGQNTNSWHQTGSGDDALNMFRSGGPFHDETYTRFRCHSWPTSAVGAANNMVARMEGNGYSILDNNCLTKAIAIFAAYGVNNLPPGSIPGTIPPFLPTPISPNFYFDNLLTNFGPVHYL